MKIAIFTELYSPSVGGQESRFAEMAELLVKRGHSVNVYCVNNIAGTAAEESLGGVSVHRYPIAADYRRPMIKSLRRRPTVIFRYSRWCREQARQEFDAYIYNQWPLMHIMLAPSDVRRKAITDWCEVRSSKLFSGIQKFVPRLTAKNMAVSLAVKEHLEKESGRPFAYVPSGIYSARYYASPRLSRRGLLYVGRITEHKNIPLLIRAFGLLRSSGYAAGLTIAGAGPSSDAVKTLCDESPYREHIELLGFVSEQQKIQLLSEAELLLIPSKREGFPRVVAEAMGSGLPVVTVDFPENGTREVVRHYGIGLVAAPEAASLAEAVTQALSRWDEYSRAGLASRDLLDWEVVLNEVLNLAAIG